MHSVHVYLVGFGCCVVGILFILPTSTHAALDCYVCRDCETTFNASHVVTCSKSTARCVVSWASYLKIIILDIIIGNFSLC